jgi:hypothetical protein
LSEQLAAVLGSCDGEADIARPPRNLIEIANYVLIPVSKAFFSA